MDTQKVIAFLLGILTLFAIGFVLDVTQPVVLPLVISLLLSFLLTPLLRTLTKKLHVPRFLAILLIIGVLFGIAFLLGWFVYNSVESFIQEYPKYQQRLQSIFSDVVTSPYLKGLDIPKDMLQEIDWQGQIRERLLSISGSFMTFVGIIIIITVILVFLFLETPHFKVKLQKAYPPHMSKRIGIMLEHITRQVSRYLGVKLFVSFLTGLTTTITLLIIGMDFPIVWGALAFLLNFIPQLGSIVFVIVVIVVGIVQFYPSITQPLTIGISMTGLQLLFGQFLDPLLSGERLDLSPVFVLASLLFWGWLWGVVGALIAVPIAATMKIVCANIPVLKPVSILLGTGYKRKLQLFKKKRRA